MPPSPKLYGEAKLPLLDSQGRPMLCETCPCEDACGPCAPGSVPTQIRINLSGMACEDHDGEYILDQSEQPCVYLVDFTNPCGGGDAQVVARLEEQPFRIAVLLNVENVFGELALLSSWGESTPGDQDCAGFDERDITPDFNAAGTTCLLSAHEPP